MVDLKHKGCGKEKRAHLGKRVKVVHRFPEGVQALRLSGSKPSAWDGEDKLNSTRP